MNFGQSHFQNLFFEKGFGPVGVDIHRPGSIIAWRREVKRWAVRRNCTRISKRIQCC